MTTTIPARIRAIAADVTNLGRTSSTDARTAIVADLYAVAEELETAPAPSPIEPPGDTDLYPYLATFQGQAWVLDNAIPVDDSRFTFPVSAAELRNAGGPEADDFDALQTAHAAPPEVRGWSGPFEISVERRPYMIESDGADTVALYADDLEGARVLLRELLTEDAALEGEQPRPDVMSLIEHTQDPDLARIPVAFVGYGFTQYLYLRGADLDPVEDA